MKTPKPFLIAAIVFAFTSSFYLYNRARTMRETVHFDVTASLLGLVFAVVLPLLVLLPLLQLSRRVWSSEKGFRLPWSIAAIGISLILGSFAAEAWILYDEVHFAHELSKMTMQTPYSRSRAWPNQNCSLVFVPGEGIHSTD